ncbi:hypothetical protein IKK_02177 [Bacillus mycoides]|uniref:Uncharacterized protein n=4 Tax=Bacillus cereus group TaxID=86661 RepID=A0AAP8GUK6_BACMY|nr:hypothetical protein IKK_02177 [Bacillus mycoides]PJN62998.1 hypothetical protein BACWE_51920 [Bacillus mycoides]PJN66062.1 hypothetical protein BAWEI_19810 [Bacillus mycoides]QWG39216.1 hypothetical protein EXW35_12550 [Bacillus mycoides]
MLCILSIIIIGPRYDEVKKYHVSKIESGFEIQICSNERQKVLEKKVNTSRGRISCITYKKICMSN